MPWDDGTSTGRTGSEIEDAYLGSIVLAPEPTGSDQTAELQALWDDYNVLQLRAGTYFANLAPNADGKEIRGVRRGTVLKKASDAILLDMSGSASDADGATHRAFCTVRDLTLDGGSNSTWNQPLMRTYYCNNLLLQNVFFRFNYGEAIRGVEWWDSLIDGCQFVECGDDSGTRPAVHILHDDATVGNFGYSAYDCNMLTFRSCRWESFRDGAVWVVPGLAGTGEANNIRFVDGCKFESSFSNWRGSGLKFYIGRAITVRDAYFYIGALASGATAGPIIYCESMLDSHFDNLYMANGDAGAVTDYIHFNGGNARNRVWGANGRQIGAITGYFLNFDFSFNSVDVRDIRWSTNAGSRPLYDGSPSKPWQIELAGTPEGNLAGVIGSLAQDATNGVLYVKTSGTGTTGWTALS